MALTLEQVDAIREAVRAWRRARGLSGLPPDGHEQIIEVMLERPPVSARCSRSAACDVDVTVSPATVRICGTIISRQESRPTASTTPHGEVDPGRVGAELHRRGAAGTARCGASEPASDHLLFVSRNYTPDDQQHPPTAPDYLAEAGIKGVTLHRSAAPSPRCSTGQGSLVPSRPSCWGTRPRRSRNSTTSSPTRPSTPSRPRSSKRRPGVRRRAGRAMNDERHTLSHVEGKRVSCCQP